MSDSPTLKQMILMLDKPEFDNNAEVRAKIGDNIYELTGSVSFHEEPNVVYIRIGKKLGTAFNGGMKPINHEGIGPATNAS